MRERYVFQFLDSLTGALWHIGEAIEKGTKRMANNFEQLTAAVDRVSKQVELIGGDVRAVADAIANPAVDNNSQPVIDDLTGRLNAAGDALDSASTALASATEAENAEDAGPASPAPAEEPASTPAEEAPIV